MKEFPDQRAKELQGIPVTLRDVLHARDCRALRQKKMNEQFGMPLISFTLNLPGPLKAFPLAGKTYEEGKRKILRELGRHKIRVVDFCETLERTGYEGIFAVDAVPEELKRWCVAIEESSPLGRLFDIDVLSRGTRISRTDLGFPERKCLLCGNPAPVCARSRAHSVDELFREVVSVMRSHFDGLFLDETTQFSERAMLYEVSTTPKPGLVDRAGNGAHKDMDFYTFIDSSVSLTPYFREMTAAAINFKETPAQLFDSLREIGCRAEEAMLSATGGVNTHRGAIYSLGILCAARGYLYGRGYAQNTELLCRICGEIAEPALQDFCLSTEKTPPTHGKVLYEKYGITGIRGETAGGFPSVTQYALPVLLELTHRGISLNDAGVVAYLNLLAHVQDTNFIYRSDMESLIRMQAGIKEFFKGTRRPVQEILSFANHLDRLFIRDNVSPGGCADLLAIAYMLYFLNLPGDAEKKPMNAYREIRPDECKSIIF